jgi:hypothetical protein
MLGACLVIHVGKHFYGIGGGYRGLENAKLFRGKDTTVFVIQVCPENKIKGSDWYGHEYGLELVLLFNFPPVNDHARERKVLFGAVLTKQVQHALKLEGV